MRWTILKSRKIKYKRVGKFVKKQSSRNFLFIFSSSLEAEIQQKIVIEQLNAVVVSFRGGGVSVW